MPQIAGGDEGEFVLKVKGDSMVNAGIFEGDYVVVKRQETAARRRDRGRARGGGGHGQALLPRGRARASPAGERLAGADPLARGARCSGAWWVSAGGSRELRAARAARRTLADGPHTAGSACRPRPDAGAASLRRLARPARRRRRSECPVCRGTDAPRRGWGRVRRAAAAGCPEHGGSPAPSPPRPGSPPAPMGCAPWLDLAPWVDAGALAGLPLTSPAKQPRGGRGEIRPLEESPDTAGQGWSGDRPGETRGKVPQKHTA